MRRIAPEIKTTLIIALSFCGISMMVAATARYLIVIIPLMILWISYVLTSYVRITINGNSSTAINNKKVIRKVRSKENNT